MQFSNLQNFSDSAPCLIVIINTCTLTKLENNEITFSSLKFLFHHKNDFFWILHILSHSNPIRYKPFITLRIFMYFQCEIIVMDWRAVEYSY